MIEAREMTAEEEIVEMLRAFSLYEGMTLLASSEARTVVALIDASRAREKALVEALRPFAYPGPYEGRPSDAQLRSVARAVLAPYSAPTEPEMPGDCHPQEG